MIRNVLNLIFLLLIFIPHCFAKETQNVVINNVSESYYISDNKIDKTKQYTYEAVMNSVFVTSLEYFNSSYKKIISTNGPTKVKYTHIDNKDIFYDDVQAAYFNFYIKKAGKTQNVIFKSEITDVKHFNVIFFDENYFTKEKTITINVPANLRDKYKIHEVNFGECNNISSKKETNSNGDLVYTYTIKNIDVSENEDRMPDASFELPHLVVVGAFVDYNDLYKWSIDLCNIDCSIPNADSIISVITKDCVTDLDKIESTLFWVSSHVRYIAFESGIASHQPDKPSEVLRKGYGDCKGMSMLLRELLRLQKFDARLSYTALDLKYKVSQYPCLSSLNHCICTVIYDGKKYYLDATHRYLPLAFTSVNLQGQEVLIENGDNCILETIPTESNEQQLDSTSVHFYIDNNKLNANIDVFHRGNRKENILRLLDITAQSKHDILLQSILVDNTSCELENPQIIDKSQKAEFSHIAGKANNIKTITFDNNEIFVKLDLYNDLSEFVDTVDRKHDIDLSTRAKEIKYYELEIPQGYQVQYLPENYYMSTPYTDFYCEYSVDGNTVVFKKYAVINKTHIKLSDYANWCNAYKKWHQKASEQIILEQIK